MKRRKTVSVTPAIGARIVAGEIRTSPIKTESGMRTCSGASSRGPAGMSQYFLTFSFYLYPRKQIVLLWVLIMLKIPEGIFSEIRRHGEETYPYECCGVLLGQADLDQNERQVSLAIRCGNTRTDSAHNRYHIDPKELIAAQKTARQRGEDIVGFYHSHPDHPAQWSPTDFAEAHWIGCSYMITAVAKGKAEITNSFLLDGSTEEDKKFVDEKVEVL